MDNSSGPAPSAGIPTVESAANYASDYASLLGAVRQAIAPRWIMANTSGFYSETNSVIPQVQGRFEEFLIRALSSSTAQFEDVAALVCATTGVEPVAIRHLGFLADIADAWRGVRHRSDGTHADGDAGVLLLARESADDVLDDEWGLCAGDVVVATLVGGDGL